MVAIKVKWGKQTYDVEADVTQTVGIFKAQLESLTGVPADKQKLLGLKGGIPKSADDSLANYGLTDGKTIMLVGSAEAPSEAKVGTTAVESEGNASTAVAIEDHDAWSGLQNIGNTCYLNSALQLLRSIPELRPLLSQCSQPLEKELVSLFRSLDSTKQAAIPLVFWGALTRKFPIFAERGEHGGLMQHDSQEALGSILQDIGAQLTGESTLKVWDRLLQGELSQATTCDETFNGEPLDETKGQPVSQFNMLSCNINEEVQTLEAGLEKSFLEVIKAQSSQLGKEVTLTRTSRLSQLPEYLLVHMVRFSWKNDIQKKAKILKPISFPMILDVFTLCTPALKTSMEPERERVKARRDVEYERRKRSRQKTDTDEKSETAESEAASPVEGDASVDSKLGNDSGYYELCGVISHKGRSAEGGHYVYWGKVENQWIVYDDNNVATVSEDDVKRLRGAGEAHIAYVLLYRSRDPKTKQGPLLL